MYEMALYQEKIGKIDNMLKYLKDTNDKHCFSTLKLYFYYQTKHDKNNMVKYFNVLKFTHNLQKDKIFELLITNLVYK